MSQKDLESSFNQIDRRLHRGFSHVYSALQQLARIASEAETTAVPDSLARSLMLARVRCEEVIAFATKQYWDAATDYAHFERIAETIAKKKDRIELLTRARRQLKLHRENLRALSVEVREFERGSTFDPVCCDPIAIVKTTEEEADSTIAECLRPAFLWTDEWGQSQVTPAEVTVYRFDSAVSENLAPELAAAGANDNKAEHHSKCDFN